MNRTTIIVILFNYIMFSFFGQSVPVSITTGTYSGESSERIRKDSSKLNLNLNLKGQYKRDKNNIYINLLSKVKTGSQDSNTVNNLLEIWTEMQSILPSDTLMQYLLRAQDLCFQLLQKKEFKESKSIKTKLSLCHNFIGILKVKEGDTKAGIVLFEKSLRLREETGDLAGTNRSYNNLGASYALMGDLVKATEYHLKALRLSEQIGDSMSLGYSYYNLCKVNMQGKNYDLALKYGESSLLIRKNIRDLKGIVESLTNQGSIYYYNNNLSKALEFGFKALLLSDSLGFNFEKANNLNNIANAYSSQGNFKMSLVYLQEALVLYRSMGDQLNIQRTLGNLGLAYYCAGNYEMARKTLLANVDALKRHDQTDVLETTYLTLSKCDSALGNFKEALLYAKLHSTMVYESMQTERLRQINELQIVYGTEKRDREHILLKQKSEVQATELQQSRYLTLAISALLFFAFLSVLLMFRQRNYRAEQRALQLEQKLLRLQMNPHFIFNSLQAIQNYILKHNEKESIRYLSAFASLTRDVLENSLLESISLKKEIALLKNYLQLQKLRFGNRFDYEIHVAGDLDEDTVHIPPMLSQPFIENAIEHGLKDVEVGGKIDVYFARYENTLLMEIVDNGTGIGTKDSALKGHSSLAMEITRERVNLLNKKTKALTTFVVSDAYGQETKRKGVRIKFSIPLNFATLERSFYGK